MDLLIADLDKDMTEAATEEKVDQKGYEQAMADSAKKRTVDSKSLGDKEASKADLEASLDGASGDLASTGKDLMATAEYIQSLHGECDFTLKYYDVRKQAR